MRNTTLAAVLVSIAGLTRLSEVMLGLAHLGTERRKPMSQIGEPVRVIEVEPLEEPVPEKEVPLEQPFEPVKDPV